MSKSYFVYIMTNKNNSVLYTGITNDILRRTLEHKVADKKHFTGKYHITKLVYFEETSDVLNAIAREKQIKAGSRQKKIDLINKLNPDWNDLLEI